MPSSLFLQPPCKRDDSTVKDVKILYTLAVLKDVIVFNSILEDTEWTRENFIKICLLYVNLMKA